MRCASLTKAQLHWDHTGQAALQTTGASFAAIAAPHRRCRLLKARGASLISTSNPAARTSTVRRCIARPCAQHSRSMRCSKATFNTALAPGAVGSGLLCCCAEPFNEGSRELAVPSAARRWTSMHCVSLLQKPHASAPAARSAALSERYSDGDTPLNTSPSFLDDALAAAIACANALNVDHHHEAA